MSTLVERRRPLITPTRSIAVFDDGASDRPSVLKVEGLVSEAGVHPSPKWRVKEVDRLVEADEAVIS